MPSQRAILTRAAGDARVVSEAPLPKPRGSHLIVKTKAVALNPTDWMHIDYMPSTGAIPGCDFAGTVEQVGKAVTGDFQVGDRVAGVTHGGIYSSTPLNSNPFKADLDHFSSLGNALNHNDGAFAEHVSAKASVVLKIPDSMSFEEAATLGAGITTVGQALYQSLGLPYPTQPTKDKIHLLIYGGSTATGTLAIQYAKLSGLEVTALSSAHNFDLLKSLGAHHVFDYHSPTVSADIRTATDNKLQYAFDCIATTDTAKICVDAMGPAGGKYTSLLSLVELPREDVSNASTAMYTCFGEDFMFGKTGLSANPNDEKFAGDFWELTEKFLAEGKIKAHPPQVCDGGLEGVLEGLQDLREQKVSGVKLVYKV
ncbi:MAG: hypothetical protein LQ338_003374 [Usnochroma carphineum]|nr:MAG: hypothetical protein LQ338_003374 [Usnochroma carphineum]